MKSEIQLMHDVWKREVTGQVSQSNFSLEDIVSSVVATGPFYFYLIDFSDYSISNVSASFTEAHGIAAEKIKSINDVLNLIHPDDMPFVAKAEEKAIYYLYDFVLAGKVTQYKVGYNFRLKTASGKYELFNHQVLVISTDENGRYVKSINIHTNISHLTDKNNYKLSLIGLNGHPSYLNLEVLTKDDLKQLPPLSENTFSKREIDIIKMLQKGLNSNDIAKTLHISFDTVKTHRKNILKKSGCKNTPELISRGVSEGWI